MDIDDGLICMQPVFLHGVISGVEHSSLVDLDHKHGGAKDMASSSGSHFRALVFNGLVKI
jgi:hypothetical protein